MSVTVSVRGSTPLRYPAARIEAAEDTLAGVSFPDPYRWLERDADEVRNWQRQQATLAGGYVREWRSFDALKRLVDRFHVERQAALPKFAAGHWFRTHRPPGQASSQVLVAGEPMGKGRVVFDCAREDPEKPPFLSWISPSPDGRTLALGLCFDGSEHNAIRLVDVATGGSLDDAPGQTLMDNWTGGAHWLPDSSGFFFTGLSGAPDDFEQKVHLHRRKPHASTVCPEIAWTEAKDWRMVVVAGDGRHALALERLLRPIPVAIAELGREPLRFRPFVTSCEGALSGHLVKGRYVAVTDVGAPRGRVVAIDPDAPDPGDPRAWRELVPESEAVLRTITPVGDVLYLSELVETYGRLRVIDADGKPLGEVPLPSRGALAELGAPLMNLAQHRPAPRFVFGFSSLTVSPAIYSHVPGATGIEVLQAPAAQIESAVVEDRWATSRDGTRIPYHLVRCSDLDASRPQPTLIFAYGGYNVPLVPQFPGGMAAFVAAGGAFVHAHLRGGGEFGHDWWKAGRQTRKQNCFDDLYAVAENLIAAGRTEPRLLAVTGGSNGGLTAGVAAMQRPDLWAAVVPRVPVLDLIGACRTPYGRMATIMERANIDDAEEVRRLAAFSPYHLVRDGVRYPAIFLDAGDTDPRCPPWHARKFAARLQAATDGAAPVLLHVWENVGHGWATERDIAVTEQAEWLSFILRQLGIESIDADAPVPPV